MSIELKRDAQWKYSYLIVNAIHFQRDPQLPLLAWKAIHNYQRLSKRSSRGFFTAGREGIKKMTNHYSSVTPVKLRFPRLQIVNVIFDNLH